jgi:hypothetical protein
VTTHEQIHSVSLWIPEGFTPHYVEIRLPLTCCICSKRTALSMIESTHVVLCCRILLM